MLEHAFKEWAVICRALALGRQSILLRKGGIAEPGGEFQVEHTRFWLYPTFLHQQAQGIKPEALPLLEEVRREREGQDRSTVRLCHWAEVAGIYRVRDLVPALLLSHLHLWSDAEIEKRFRYRWPGIHVLCLRVFQAPQFVDLAETERYQGCKSWVNLDTALPTADSRPVLDESQFGSLRHSLDLLLQPTALA